MKRYGIEDLLQNNPALGGGGGRIKWEGLTDEIRLIMN